MKNVPLFKVFMPKEVDQAILDTLHSGYISEGPKVKELREMLRNFIGNQYVIPTSSGTMALLVSYRLAGVGPCTEVITTPVTCIATNLPILELGADIVWADSNPKTGMIDPKSIEENITSKTKAIVVLHKDGDLAEMDEIISIAKKHNIKIIEDAAHAFGAKYKGKNVGTISDYACFSLQAVKQITTGDGGFLTVRNQEDFDLAKKLKWFGMDKEVLPPGVGPYEVDISILGYKGNMNDVAATIGIEQMKYAGEILEKFHKNGKFYSELFKNVPGVELLPRRKEDFETYWVYTVLVENRDKVVAALKAEGIASGIIHPRNDNYSVFNNYKRDLPGVDYFTERELSLPCGWWVEKEDIERIVEIIKRNI